MRKLTTLGALAGALAFPAGASAVVVPGATYTGTFTTGTPGATVSLSVSADATQVDFLAEHFGNNTTCVDNSVSRDDIPISGDFFSYFDSGPPFVGIGGTFTTPGRANGNAQISGVCNSGLQSWTAQTLVVWPDGSVGRSSDSGGQRRTFEVGIENDGTEAGAFLVDGCRGSGKFKVKYFDGADNVTAAVVAGDYTSDVIAPDGYRELDLKMKPTRRANPGNRKTCEVTIRSGGRTDVVKAQLKAKRG
jgi:hypothetical protein